MPFGLTNVPATFQSYINAALHPFLDKFAIAYIDDILIYSNSLEENHEHMHTILKTLLDHGLYSSLNEC